MSLTRLAIQYRPVTYVLLFVTLALGVFALTALPRREDPDIQPRTIQVIALYPGATANQVEELVTERLERAILEINDIKAVQSASRPGIAVLSVDGSDHAKDLPAVWQEIRDRVGDARGDLPAGVVSVAVNDRFGDVAALVFGVTRDGATDREREDIAKRVRDRLRSQPDIADVKLIGAQEERITVSLSAQRMARLAVTPTDVSGAIARRNVLPVAGGSVALGEARLDISPTGNLRSERDLTDMVVAAPDGKPIYLRDVATITRGYADPASLIARVNGKPAVVVALTFRKGRIITTVGDQVKRDVEALRADLPPGTNITVLNDLPRSVERRMGEFYENLLAGLGLILVIMYLFMGLRSALIVGAMLPITILGTFAAMYFCGRDIQQISIAALIIALGLVVDNSIVVMDNIEVKLHQGMDRMEAAISGADELRVPLLTANLTTLASFAPIGFLSGPVGEFIRDLAVVTSLATVVSLIFNLTITPLIALRFLHSTAADRQNVVRRLFTGLIDRLRDGISWLAARSLRHPVITVGLATLALILAVATIPRLGLQFFPSAERNQFSIDVWLPEGRDIRATERAAARVEKILAGQSGVQSYATYVGQGGPRFYYNLVPEAPASNYAQIVVNTDSIEHTGRLVPIIQKAADATVSEARVTVKTLEQGPPVGAPIAVRISGPNVNQLRDLGERVRAILNATPGTASVYQNYGELPLSLKVAVDEDQAALAGLSATDIAQTTQMGFSGLTASYLREGDKQIPIQLRFDPAERAGAESLADLYLPSNAGGVVPLRQVASVSLAPQEGRIIRRNHVRTLIVYAFADGTRLASQMLAEVQPKIAALALPPGYSVSYGGEAEEVERSFSEIFLILGLSLAANLVIVLWEFNSARIATVIMLAVPYSMTGAILGLYLTGQPFGLMAFLGITALGGVITNHEIILFEYALEEQRRGLPLEEALVEAGRSRLRPILLTVMLSIGGLLPQAINGGNLWPPMAWGLIFGLLMALIQSLVTMRSFYVLLSGRRRAAPVPNETAAASRS